MLRKEFDQLARELAPKTSTYLLRKAALGLRKSHRLKPELVVRVADWGRQIESYALSELRDNLEQIPQQPGVYLFADSSGYLYIGEAENLRKRLTDHLHQSDRPALGKYLEQFRKKHGRLPQNKRGEPRSAATRLDNSGISGLAVEAYEQDDQRVYIEIHAFDPKSPARQVAMRRAYESELIRSRKPKFNIRP